VIKLLGEIHRTEDGQSFFIDFAQVIPRTGAYDVVLFGIRNDERNFAMGVAFPKASMSAWGAGEALVREGLVQLRDQLDHGVEEDGSLVEVPSGEAGGWRPSYRFSAPSRTYHA
jgi:hypothetical protein